jgi:DNA-binding transcriptional ArsR family regulator
MSPSARGGMPAPSFLPARRTASSGGGTDEWVGDIVSHMANDPFKAVAHPIRRGIVERLARGPATVGVVTRGFGVSKPTISKHLKVLEREGVVLRTVSGRTHLLDLNPVPLAEAADWFDEQRVVWTRMFDAVDDLLAARREKP